MRKRRIALLALYGGLSAVFCAPLFEFPHGLGVYDWDQHLFYYGAVLKSVIEYGQPPFWNPWYCGGGVLWQNPQAALLSPVYPLAVILPLPLAMKVNIFLHYWVGFVGMHLLLTRVVGVRFLPGVVYLASVFALSGAPAIHLLAGHSNFLPIFYLPFMLFFASRRGDQQDPEGASLPCRGVRARLRGSAGAQSHAIQQSVFAAAQLDPVRTAQRSDDGGT
jgi:hypothetical protein